MVATLVGAAASAVVFAGSSGASLATSPFEGGDGNMVVDTAGHTDWESLSAPQLRTLIDVPSGTSDNSFTGGSHEDDPNVTIAQGSIPPNKNDLTRAYLASETISNEVFLYLAWERQPNPNGSANIDFELDQNASAGDFTQPGDLTINRTEGDLLITYDFGGSGTPDLGLLTWLTPGNGHSDSDCEASGQKLPCWGNRIDLNPNSNPPAEAGVNAGTIDEVFAGGQLDAGSFGEAKIDLSAVPGLFTPDTCKAFGNMFVKSRASGSSIDAELKDFIGPAPVQVSNCATPGIATQTSVTSMNVGQTETVGDTATLSGGNNPTGDVSFQLYSDANCQTPVAGVSGTAALDAGGVATFAGAPFTASQAGTYFWGVSYPGDNHNNSASACGGPNEEIVVKPAEVSITKTADHSSAVLAGSQIGFTVEIKNTGAGDATGVGLSDPLPAGSGSGVTWAIDPSVGTPAQFVLGGAKGSQTLSLSSTILPAGADYTVHLTAVTSATECGTYDNTATLTTGNAANPNPASAEEACRLPQIDLAVTKAGSPSSQTLGDSNITWTMIVTNNGPDTATGVSIADPMPAGNTFVSATTSAGTCTGGAVLSCSLGTMAPGAKVTITLVTTPTAAGTVTNTVTVVANEHETNTANNTATATVVVNQFTPPPPVFCVAVSKVTPKQLFVGRTTKLTIRLTKHGQAVKGVRVRIKGPKIDLRTTASNSTGVITQRVKIKKAGIVIFTPIASKRCNTKRVGVTGVFTPPVTG